MKIETGTKAPKFSLYNSEKNKVSLSDYNGKNVLLLFFPLCGVRDNISQYNKSNADVVGISVDSIYTLAKYKEEQHLNFQLFSDFNKEVSTLYGSIYQTFGFDMQGVSKRSAFLIDRDGIVRYAEVLDNASEIPDFEAIQKVLLQHN